MSLTPEEQGRRSDAERDRLLHLNAPIGPQRPSPLPVPGKVVTVPPKVDGPALGQRAIERELDAMIDQVLFKHKVEWRLLGDRVMPFRAGQSDFGMPMSVPYYQTKIEDAWLIVEELRRRGIALSIDSRLDLNPNDCNCDDLVRLKDEKYQVQRWNRDSQRLDPPVYGGTAPEAICKAAAIVVWMKV
jgi:hypothetical protein